MFLFLFRFPLIIMNFATVLLFSPSSEKNTHKVKARKREGEKLSYYDELAWHETSLSSFIIFLSSLLKWKRRRNIRQEIIFMSGQNKLMTQPAATNERKLNRKYNKLSSPISIFLLRIQKLPSKQISAYRNGWNHAGFY